MTWGRWTLKVLDLSWNWGLVSRGSQSHLTKLGYCFLKLWWTQLTFLFLAMIFMRDLSYYILLIPKWRVMPNLPLLEMRMHFSWKRHPACVKAMSRSSYFMSLTFFGKVKTVGIYILKKKVLLVTHLPISPMLNAAVQVTSPRNSGWSRRLIYRLWHRRHKQKTPFPQGFTTDDHQNPALNHS